MGLTARTNHRVLGDVQQGADPGSAHPGAAHVHRGDPARLRDRPRVMDGRAWRTLPPTLATRTRASSTGSWWPERQARA